MLEAEVLENFVRNLLNGNEVFSEQWYIAVIAQ